MAGAALLSVGARSGVGGGLAVSVTRATAALGGNVFRVTFTANATGGTGAYGYSWNVTGQGVQSTASTYSYTYNIADSDPAYSGVLTVTSGSTITTSFG